MMVVLRAKVGSLSAKIYGEDRKMAKRCAAQFMIRIVYETEAQYVNAVVKVAAVSVDLVPGPGRIVQRKGK